VTTSRPLDWEQLYQYYSGADSRRADQERRYAEELAALHDFEAWSQRASELVMEDLRRLAIERSRIFEERTGQALSVEYPSGPAIQVPQGGPEIRFLSLALGEARVHIYSSHTPGGLIHLHLLPSRRNSLSHNQRLLSEPGAFLVRQEDDTYQLRFQPGDPDAKLGAPMALDVLLFRAFRMLVQWAEMAPAPLRRRGGQR
jgi:hypothetical protein